MNIENVMMLYQYAWRMIGHLTYAKLTHGFKNVTICCSNWSLEDFQNYLAPPKQRIFYNYQVLQNSCLSQSPRMLNTTQVISFKISKLNGLILTLYWKSTLTDQLSMQLILMGPMFHGLQVRTMIYQLQHSFWGMEWIK